MQAGAVDPLTPGIKPVLELVRRYPNLYLGAGFVGEVWDDGTEASSQARRIHRPTTRTRCT
jgi:hypothetical protein